jgi:hypothetical protein
MELSLLQKIESLRYEMVNEALIQGSFTDVKVIELSQQLDQYIVFFQKLKKIRVA